MYSDSTYSRVAMDILFRTSDFEQPSDPRQLPSFVSSGFDSVDSVEEWLFTVHDKLADDRLRDERGS